MLQLQRPDHGVMRALGQRSMWSWRRAGVSSRSFHYSISQRWLKANVQNCEACVLESQCAHHLRYSAANARGMASMSTFCTTRNPSMTCSDADCTIETRSNEPETTYTENAKRPTEHGLQRRERDQIRTLPLLDGKTAHQIAGEYEAAERPEIRHRREHACVITGGALSKSPTLDLKLSVIISESSAGCVTNVQQAATAGCPLCALTSSLRDFHEVSKHNSAKTLLKDGVGVHASVGVGVGVTVSVGAGKGTCASD